MGGDNTHGGSFYLVDSTDSAIKDLTFESKSTSWLFRCF